MGLFSKRRGRDHSPFPSRTGETPQVISHEPIRPACDQTENEDLDSLHLDFEAPEGAILVPNPEAKRPGRLRRIAQSLGQRATKLNGIIKVKTGDAVSTTLEGAARLAKNKNTYKYLGIGALVLGGTVAVKYGYDFFTNDTSPHEMLSGLDNPQVELRPRQPSPLSETLGSQEFADMIANGEENYQQMVHGDPADVARMAADPEAFARFIISTR